MAKVYTAQEMRDRADYERKVNGNSIASAMLRQAADLMEREKEYEYSLRTYLGNVLNEHERSLQDAKTTYRLHNGIIVRRPVGEWEEVRDGE